MQKKKFLVKVNVELCKGCELCVNVCPQHCLAISEELNAVGTHFAIVSNSEHCSGCKRCALICPDAVIVIESYEKSHK